MKNDVNPLGNIAYEKIIEMIFKKQIKVGEKLFEQELADKFGVSRTPIREAFRRLANEGIINIFQNRYSEVINFNEKSIINLGLIRISLDSLASQLAIYYGSNNDFLNLKKIAEQSKKFFLDGDLYNYIKYDCDFHLKLAEIGRNDILFDIQKKLYLIVRLLQTIRPENELNSDSAFEHLQVADKLLERNVKGAVKLIQTHLSKFYKVQVKGSETIIFN